MAATSRKDSKGRKLHTGESQRKDGIYLYRYTDAYTGKRTSVYANDLPELRRKEKAIAKDIDDNILTDISTKNLTLNTLFERYLGIMVSLLLMMERKSIIKICGTSMFEIR